ncbi:MAG: DNA topoisomerase IB [Saprospiraceae bacterium]
MATSKIRLVHVSAESLGYTRKGRGKGFEYFDSEGKKTTDKNEINRIQKLRIPPAWKNVWICQNPDGHIQATGIDARGRKQYIYHEEWNRRSQITKFERMIDFGKSLPDIRRRINLDLNKQGWPREKVISLVISLLDKSALRIGNKSYELENGTFGLTTLKRKHLKIEKGGIAFQFKAKGGLYRRTEIRSKKLTRLIIECSELPGQEVFQYLDSDDNTHTVYSQDVNGYLQEITGGEFTAKDFRTWGGTVWALELFPEAKAEIENSSKKSLLKNVVAKAADKLGNTIAVCKAHYIHPAIIELAEKDEVDYDKLMEEAGTKYEDLKDNMSKTELATLYLIEG